MSRYTNIVQRLQEGESVTYKEFGNSMLPKLKSGVSVTVTPYTVDQCRVGEIVLAKVSGSYFLHYVKAIASDGKVQIANAHGHINGWTRSVYGKLTVFENP